MGTPSTVINAKRNLSKFKSGDVRFNEAVISLIVSYLRSIDAPVDQDILEAVNRNA